MAVLLPLPAKAAAVIPIAILPVSMALEPPLTGYIRAQLACGRIYVRLVEQMN